MLNAETKRHIDTARDVLVGVAPNPMTQIDQITYALIYKFMDDMDQAAIKAGGEPSFFTGELEPYAWSRLVDSRMGNQEKMNLYGEALQKFSEAKQLPELFRTIFRAAFLPYRSPETLGLFLKEISFFDYTHPEDLGNAYEYLLSIMSAQGDAGQFRTPRHVIDFMVDVLNPTKDDSVLDPACGTGGFLVASYNHILEQHDGKNDPNNTEKSLTPDERKKLMNNFEGYDIDPSMVRIAQVNMYLHQFKNPRIYQYDSLTNEERWNDKFDVILANPPFMTPKGGIKPHNKFAIKASRSEVLFVDYIVNHLKPNGRAGIIVPEGIVFQNGKAYKQLRQDLLKAGLYAVLSLPSGVFQPYSGVKTSILLIDRRVSENPDQVLFVDVKNLGISLGAARNVVKDNDLPRAQKILDEFRTRDIEADDQFAFSVPRTEIEAKDFSLNASIYRQSSKGDKAYPIVPLQDVCDITKGKSSSTKTEAGAYPLFLTAETPKSASHFDFSGAGVAVPLISATGHGKADIKRVHYVEGDFALANLLAFVKPQDKALLSPKFLFHVLNGNKSGLASLMKGAANVSMKVSDLEQFSIPLPSLEVQEQTVAELERYSSIIDGARNIAENWRPKIQFDSAWPVATLGEVAEYINGFAFKPEDWSSTGGLPIVRIQNLTGSSKSINSTHREDVPLKYRIEKGDLLISWSATIGVYIWDGPEAFLNQHIFKVVCSERILRKYLYFLGDQISESIKAKTHGNTMQHITKGLFEEIEIPLPSVEIQESIVEKLEKEESLIKSNSFLINEYESRKFELLNNLWNG